MFESRSSNSTVPSGVLVVLLREIACRGEGRRRQELKYSLEVYFDGRDLAERVAGLDDVCLLPAEPCPYCGTIRGVGLLFCCGLNVSGVPPEA
jgi:hypothetical protein